MKKSTLISLSLLTAISFSAVVSVASLPNGFRSFINTIADGNLTKITLNDEHKPVIDSENNYSLELTNQFTTLKYKNATAYGDGHIELLPGGSIAKNNASKDDNVSNGLESITATFVDGGDLRIQTSYKEGEIDYVYTLQSGVEQKIKGNYFKILTYDGAKIDNLELSFGCVPGAFVDGANKYKNQLDEYKIVNPNGTGNDAFMSINAFNSNYKSLGVTANVVDVDGENCELYIITEENRITKFENCLATLDFSSSSLTGYEKVVVTGGGELAFNVQTGDGMTCNDFVVEYGTTLKLSRASQASSGVSPLKKLEIYGNLEISGFNHGIGLNNSNEINVDIKKSGNLNINNCAKNGFTIWEYATNAEVNIAGTTNITCGENGFLNSSAEGAFNVSVTGNLTITCAKNGFDGTTYNFPLTFGEKAKATITTSGTDFSGIYMKSTCATFIGNSEVTINANDGYGIRTDAGNTEFKENSHIIINAKIGIYHHNIGKDAGKGGYRVKIKDKSIVSITSSSYCIYNFQRLQVCNDDSSDNNKGVPNEASLIAKSTGEDVIRAKNNDNTHINFQTTGTIKIESTASGKTGIHFGSKNSTSHYITLVIKCADITFKNLSNCWGLWKNISGTNCRIEYENSGSYKKIKLDNCPNVCNSTEYGNASRFSLFLAEGAVERI